MSDPVATAPSSGTPGDGGASPPRKDPRSHPLQGLARWITGPSLFGGVVGAAIAVLYGLLTLQFPPGTRWWFVGIVAVYLTVFTILGDMAEQAGLPTLSALGEGKLRPSKAVLQRAAHEAFLLPDRSLRVNLIAWSVACASIGVSFRAVPTVGWSLALRVVYLGIVLGPVSSIVTYVFVLQNAREAVRRIAAQGLTPSQVLEAIPRTARNLRTRLVAFIAVAMLTPSVFVADVLFSRSNATMEVLLSTGDPAIRAAALRGFDLGSLEGIALAVLVAAVGLFGAWKVGSSLRAPMHEIAQEAQRLSRGDLTHPRLIVAEDEVWAAAAAFVFMEEQLSRALTALRRAGVRIADTTGQLLEGSTAQASGAAEQSAALNETSATTEELARSAGQIAENAAEVQTLAERTLRAAEAGQLNAEAFFHSMLRTKADNAKVADSVVRLNKRVAQIGKIVEFINEIGDKSDLLALNAELEGTKAGDVGRGFSLVAAEMRRLAENVVRSTHEIVKLIGEIRDGTHAAVMATESGLKAMDAGSNRAQEVLGHLRAILQLARETSDAVRAISLATQQQQTGTDQLATAMGEILRITQEGSTATEQMGQANSNLSALSYELQAVVHGFQLDENAAQPEVPRG